MTGVYGPVTERDLPGPILNIASVTATVISASGGDLALPVTASHTVSVTIHPSLALTKSGDDQGPVTIGDRVHYTMTHAEHRQCDAEQT